MVMNMRKDIFISYKDNDEGMLFADNLCKALEKRGYSVYFNPNEHRAADFVEKIQVAVESCKDFILIVSQKCLDALMSGNEKDWVRFELITAKRNNKNIIPVMLNGTKMPKEFTELPEELQFLPKIDNVEVLKPQQFDLSPFSELMGTIVSLAEKDDIYRDTYNSNPNYSINEELPLIIEKAEKGDLRSMYELANIYYFGMAGSTEGTHRDYTSAHNWLTKIIESENEYTDYAYSMIAEMYYHGLVPRSSQSYEKSLEYHKKAGKNSGFSAREYAYLSSRGCGCDFDYETIVDNYKKAIDSGDNLAVVGLAKFYMDYGKYGEAAELYKKASNIMPDAEYQLGMLYRNGLLSDPPKPDFFRAAFYFQHAISSGNCDAKVYHELGRLYFTPTGDFPKDFVQAETYFLKAAELGSREAQYKLGLMYEFGYVARDVGKAIHFHTQAAEQGSALSAYHLALLYQEADYKNYHKAFKYAHIAARKGVMEGEYILGTLYHLGRGCVADEDEAYRLYKKAYEHGMYQAKIMMENIEKQK